MLFLSQNNYIPISRFGHLLDFGLAAQRPDITLPSFRFIPPAETCAGAVVGATSGWRRRRKVARPHPGDVIEGVGNGGV